MPTVRGYFQSPLGVQPASAGLVRAEVEIPTASMGMGKVFPIVFEIDTGAPSTLLLDDDLLGVVRALGYTPLRDGPVLPWMATRTYLFSRALDPLYSVGGAAGPVFLIRFASMRLCHPDGRSPGRARWLLPIYGTFSIPFLNPSPDRRHVSFRSLLGRRTLSQISSMSWCASNQRIRFRGA